GVSDPTDEHPMTAAGGAVTRFLDGLGLPRVDVIGNSMGGIVATQVALRHPERIRRLVTIGGIGRNLFSPSPGEGIKLLMEFTEEPTRERLVRWLHSMVYDPAIVTAEMIEERCALATEPATLATARRMYGKAAFAAAAEAAAAATAPYCAMLHKLKARPSVTCGRDARGSGTGQGRGPAPPGMRRRPALSLSGKGRAA